jgi:hypothetical protein
MNRNWTPRQITALVTVVTTVIALALTFVFPIPFHGPPWRDLPARIVLLIQLEVFFSTFNLLVIVVLAALYGKLYRELPNKYTGSLLLLSLALFLYAFTSNPVVHLLFGFRPRANIGAFVFIPDLFIGVAIVVLLYQSQT